MRGHGLIAFSCLIVACCVLLAGSPVPVAASGIRGTEQTSLEAAAVHSFYVDPAIGNDKNNGSFDAPWKTMDLSRIESMLPVNYPYLAGDPLQVVNPGAPVKAGDTVYLRSGDYGTLDIYGLYNTDYIILAAQAGHTPVFDQINLNGGCRWKFSGLTVRGPKPADYNYLIFLMSHDWYGPCSDMVIEDCHVCSVENISSWTADDWNNLANGGIQVSGERIVIRRDLVENVDFGIVESGNGNLVEYNTVRNYCGDGVRLASQEDVTCQYNEILNNYKVNDNHNDGIQVYVGPGNNNPVYRYVLRGNRITGHEDPAQPFADELQGIGVFDNSMVDCLVDNNVVMVSHWHGISLYGAVNTRVINNTVFNPYHRGESDYRSSRIAIVPAKNSTPGHNCTVRNNIVITIISNDHVNPVIDHNITGSFDPSALFTDWQLEDVTLKKGSPAVDTGSANLASAIDITGTVRPQGHGYDIGAYEYAPFKSRYLAEGYTGAGFVTYLCLGNPSSTDAVATVTYLFPDGATHLQEIMVPAASRATINVNGEIGDGREVSFRIDCEEAIVVERPMYFNYGGAWSGGSDVVATAAPRIYWYFAEGYTGPGFDEWVCILNPEDAPANLTFRFQTQEGEEVVHTGYLVGARSRATFKINEVLGSGYQASLKLEADQPVVAERSMYFLYAGVGGRNWTGGHCVMGATTLANEYYFAEGTTRSTFEEWLTLQNPGVSPIIVEATYQPEPGQGGPVTRSYRVEAGKRYTVFVPSETGYDKDVSVKLTSEADFLAERPMYFSYDGVWTGGHCVIGADSSGTDWFFAEGYTGDGFHEWLCLQNPGDQESTVRIAYFTQEAGALPIQEVKVPARTRLTLRVNEQAGTGYQLSVHLTVTAGPGIVVERPMYFNYGAGWDGGHDVMGYRL